MNWRSLLGTVLVHAVIFAVLALKVGDRAESSIAEPVIQVQLGELKGAALPVRKRVRGVGTKEVILPKAVGEIGRESVAAETGFSEAVAIRPIVLSYPITSRKKREEGSVLVEVTIDANGHPEDVRCVRSSGYSRLDDAAIAAVREVVFRPARRGEFVRSVKQFTLVFQLSKN